MKVVIFENRNAIFDFPLPDVIGRLGHYVEQNVREAGEVLEAVSSSPLSTIKVTSDYFAYMVLDLIKGGKGHAYCKTCKEKYDPGQLTSIPLGFGKNPLEVNLKREGGIIKRLFGKKTLICGNGGVAYECPRRHELISAMTWTGILRIPQVKDPSCP